MPDKSGNIVELRAYVDEKGVHKLETHPEQLKICKRRGRLVAIRVKNETVGTADYKPVILGFRIRGGVAGQSSRDPRTVFDDAPNFPGSSFMVPDDGRRCYFAIKQDLRITERKDPCTFPDEDPGEYGVVVSFTHEGWADAFGSGEHENWHIES